jgi:hypothetical protein
LLVIGEPKLDSMFGHSVFAEIAEALEQRPPRFIVLERIPPELLRPVVESPAPPPTLATLIDRAYRRVSPTDLGGSDDRLDVYERVDEGRGRT